MTIINLVATRIGMEVEDIDSNTILVDGWVEIEFSHAGYTVTDKNNDTTLEYMVGQDVVVNFLFDMAM